MNTGRFTKLAAVLAAVGLLAGCKAPGPEQPTTSATLTISLSRFPNVGGHARDAEVVGESKICTIDRGGATARRKDSLRGIATAPGKDRDEFPPAMCKEGGHGADVRLVPAAENRAEGAWMEKQLKRWPNGTRILITTGP